MDFLEVHQRDRVVARINDGTCQSLIREGSENDAFRFPTSKKSVWTFCDLNNLNSETE